MRNHYHCETNLPTFSKVSAVLNCLEHSAHTGLKKNVSDLHEPQAYLELGYSVNLLPKLKSSQSLWPSG